MLQADRGNETKTYVDIETHGHGTAWVVPTDGTDTLTYFSGYFVNYNGHNAPL